MAASSSTYYGKRKRSMSSTSRKSRPSGARSNARAVIARNPRIGGYLGIENKFIDYEYPYTAIANKWAGGEADPATVNSISAIAAGDGESNRDGRKCTLTSVHIRGDIRFIPASSVSTAQRPSVACVVLVLDTQTNGSQLNAEDVMFEPNDDALQAHAFTNLQYSKRFKILHRQVVKLETIAASSPALAPSGTGYPMGNITNFEINKKLDIPVIFNGTTASVSSITDNSLHVIAVTSSEEADTQLQYVSRVRFVG